MKRNGLSESEAGKLGAIASAKTIQLKKDKRIYEYNVSILYHFIIEYSVYS